MKLLGIILAAAVLAAYARGLWWMWRDYRRALR